MKALKEVIVEGESVYLKKDFTGWRTVYPITNKDGSFNWFNFITGGSYGKLMITIAIVLIILGLCWSYYHDTSLCMEILANGTNVFEGVTPESSMINLSELKF